MAVAHPESCARQNCCLCPFSWTSALEPRRRVGGRVGVGFALSHRRRRDGLYGMFFIAIFNRLDVKPIHMSSRYNCVRPHRQIQLFVTIRANRYWTKITSRKKTFAWKCVEQRLRPSSYAVFQQSGAAEGLLGEIYRAAIPPPPRTHTFLFF